MATVPGGVDEAFFSHRKTKCCKSNWGKWIAIVFFRKNQHVICNSQSFTSMCLYLLIDPAQQGDL